MHIHKQSGSMNVILTSDTNKECEDIVRFFLDYTSPKDTLENGLLAATLHSPVATPSNGRRKYKRQVPKTCAQCGKPVKGNVGLALHTARVHRTLTREALDAASSE